MPKFTQTDFSGNNITYLSTIVMDIIKKPSLLPFKHLNAREQRIFNNALNDYIDTLPEDDWGEVLLKDFCRVVSETVFTDSFDPSVLPVCPEMDTGATGTQDITVPADKLKGPTGV